MKKFLLTFFILFTTVTQTCEIVSISDSAKFINKTGLNLILTWYNFADNKSMTSFLTSTGKSQIINIPKGFSELRFVSSKDNGGLEKYRKKLSLNYAFGYYGYRISSGNEYIISVHKEKLLQNQNIAELGLVISKVQISLNS